MKSLTRWIAWKGVLALGVGVAALVWPHLTVQAFVLLFAVFAFADAGMQILRAVLSRTAGSVAVHLLLAVVNMAAGVIAVAWPDITAQVLVVIVAAWAFIGGITEIALAFARPAPAGRRIMLALAGLMWTVFAVVLAVRPDLGAITLAQVFGVFSIASGTAALLAAGYTRSLRCSLASAAGH